MKAAMTNLFFYLFILKCIAPCRSFLNPSHGRLLKVGGYENVAYENLKHRSQIQISSSAPTKSAQQHERSTLITFAETIDSYEEAMSIIDQCSRTSSPSDELYSAVRYIDRNANKVVYPTIESKEQMWEKAYGSWKLVLATGGGKYTTFKPVPIFAYARIDESTFGNGVGLNENVIFLSLLGPHVFEARRRQMQICIDDIFLFSRNVTNMMPDFLTDKIDLKKRPKDFSGKKGDRIPAFTFIASSDSSLVARGGSGGIAIWTRLENDIKAAAYNS